MPLRRDAALEHSLSQLACQPALRVGVFVCDPLSGRVASVDGERSFPAASTIKVPIAVELLRRADRGEIQLEEKLALRAEHIASGSGSLQYLPPGTVFTIRRLAELMIRRSDNTATNMIIARLGGADPLNRSFLDLGLRRTRLRRLLPDMEGRNRTSPGDLVSLLSRVSTGSLLSPGSREILLGWMRRSRVKSLLPAGLGSGALCYNKTGDIPGALGDAGLVVLPGGRRYVAAVQVERPRNSTRAGAVIRQISRAAYVRLL